MNKTNNGNGAKDRLIAIAQNHLKNSVIPNEDKKIISETNKKTITKFIEQLVAENLTKDRQAKYIYTLINISRRIDNKDFFKVNKDDVVNLISEINRTNFSEWTKRDYRIVIKRIMKYVREQQGKTFQNKQYPPEVSWLNVSMKKARIEYPKELLTIDDVKSLSEGTFNLRDKAFILFLYESGARIGEVLNIKLKDIESDEYGLKIGLMGKTGSRKIRIIASAPAISLWIKNHPKNDDKESWLFCGINHSTIGGQGEYRYFNKLLVEAAKRVSLKKPINPHHFRHSRATELAKKLTEAQLCKYMGWEIGSHEAATYVTLSGRDTDDAILSLHGLKKLDDEKDTFTPIICPRCGIKNDPGAKFCNGCSLGIDEKSIMEYDHQQEINAALGNTTLANLTPELEKIIGNLVFNMVKKELSKIQK